MLQRPILVTATLEYHGGPHAYLPYSTISEGNAGVIDHADRSITAAKLALDINAVPIGFNAARVQGIKPVDRGRLTFVAYSGVWWIPYGKKITAYNPVMLGIYMIPYDGATGSKKWIPYFWSDGVDGWIGIWLPDNGLSKGWVQVWEMEP